MPTLPMVMLGEVGHGEIVNVAHLKPCPQHSFPPFLFWTGHRLKIVGRQNVILAPCLKAIQNGMQATQWALLGW